MYEIKRFANITKLVTPAMKSAKSIINSSLKRSTGFRNNKIAKDSLSSASNMAKTTGDSTNSFMNNSNEGVSVFKRISNPKTPDIKGPELPFKGGIPSGRSPMSSGGLYSGQSGEKSPNISARDNFRKSYENKMTRAVRTNQEGPEEIQKKLNTRGQGLLFNNGPVIPGFGYSK